MICYWLLVVCYLYLLQNSKTCTADAVLAIEPEHVHLFINSPPNIAPSDLMHRIKGRTAMFLRKEFPELMKLPSMWTRAYFVSTAGNVASSTIQNYIEAQGKD